MKTHKFENGAFENDPFSLNAKTEFAPKQRHLKTRTFLCSKAVENNRIMAIKPVIGAFLTATNKRHCFEKRANNSVLLEQCERTAFSSTKTDRNENGAV